MSVPARDATSNRARGHAFITAWDQKTPLDTVQLSAVSLLSECGALPVPDHLKHTDVQSSQTVDETPRATDATAPADSLKGGKATIK